MRDFLEAMDGIIDQSQRRLDSNRELTQQGEQAEQDLKDRIAMVRSILAMAGTEENLLMDIQNAVERYQAEQRSIEEMEDDAISSTDIEYEG